MLTKILIFLGVVIGVFVVARMGAASANRSGGLLGGRKKKDKVAKSTAELKPCPTCGAYTPVGEPCACQSAPTP